MKKAIFFLSRLNFSLLARMHCRVYEEMYKRYGALPKTYNPINITLYVDGKEFSDMAIKVPNIGSDYRIPATELIQAMQQI